MTRTTPKSLRSKPASCTKGLTLFFLSLLILPSGAQGELAFLPRGYVFRPLLADPKEPRFSANLLYTRYPPHDTRGASVSLGGNIGILAGAQPAKDFQWQLSISGGVFSEFDIDAQSSDLINADYQIGFPITFSWRRFSARIRPYHQSSHIGDEYLLHNDI